MHIGRVNQMLKMQYQHHPPRDGPQLHHCGDLYIGREMYRLLGYQRLRAGPQPLRVGDMHIFTELFPMRHGHPIRDGPLMGRGDVYTSPQMQPPRL
jgi:hypothetical protein